MPHEDKGRKLSPAEAAARLSSVINILTEAAEQAGRSISKISLLAVSKTFPASMIKSYLDLGQIMFGESYIQEAVKKAEEFCGCQTEPDWHFIGHLQSNKAKYATRIISTLHSLDCLSLAAALDKRLMRDNKTMKVYIQINMAGEEQKSGLKPQDLPAFLDGLQKFPSLRPQGLMTMPPYKPDPELSRPHFAGLRELRDKHAPHLSGLSMGMSGDYKVAIEEGASIIRIGSALFGDR